MNPNPDQLCKPNAGYMERPPAHPSRHGATLEPFPFPLKDPESLRAAGDNRAGRRYFLWTPRAPPGIVLLNYRCPFVSSLKNQELGCSVTEATCRSLCCRLLPFA